MMFAVNKCQCDQRMCTAEQELQSTSAYHATLHWLQVVALMFRWSNYYLFHRIIDCAARVRRKSKFEFTMSECETQWCRHYSTERTQLMHLSLHLSLWLHFKSVQLHREFEFESGWVTIWRRMTLGLREICVLPLLPSHFAISFNFNIATLAQSAIWIGIDYGYPYAIKFVFIMKAQGR